jgi:hypothetical protein
LLAKGEKERFLFSVRVREATLATNSGDNGDVVRDDDGIEAFAFAGVFLR